MSENMPNFRMRTIFLVLVSCTSLCNLPKKPYGIKRLLLNIVDNPIDETTIMEIAAENPPKNTKTVMNWLLKNCGINSEYVSGFTDWPSKRIFPPHATGYTKTLNNNKYKGKSQTAVLM